MAIPAVVRHIWRHPIGRRARVACLTDFLRWQIGARLVPGPVAVPFVDDSLLLLEPGMSGASGNVYCGLHDPHDMSFVLHYLRESDTFVDVGANVGAYTVLAAAVRRARVVAIEPVPATFQVLQRTCRINGLLESGRVVLHDVGVAAAAGELSFVTGMDAENHVASPGDESGERSSLRVERLDDLLADQSPVMMKMDVEGYESEALRGAHRLLADDTLQVMIVEISEALRQHGSSPERLTTTIRGAGFTPVHYDFEARKLRVIDGWNTALANTLFVRDVAAAQERVESGPSFRVKGFVL